MIFFKRRKIDRFIDLVVQLMLLYQDDDVVVDGNNDVDGGVRKRQTRFHYFVGGSRDLG